jgi:hypothetical protein
MEIPFVLSIPVKYREFENLLKKYGAHYKSKKSKNSCQILAIILSRLVNYNKAADRTKLPQLYNYMMRYVLQSVEEHKKISQSVRNVCEAVVPHLHALILLNPTECVETIEKGELFDDFFPLRTGHTPLYKVGNNMKSRLLVYKISLIY